MAWNWPWPGRRVEKARTPAEQKAATGFVAFHISGGARWTSRDYGALAREGFMRNPVVHR